MLLQRDLDRLIEWTKTWGMEFNVKKCNVLSVTLKTKKKLRFRYKMNGQEIQGIQDTKYLGVTFTEKLEWNTHISLISGAANRMLGFLWRNLKSCPRPIKEKAYKALIRPKIEYCSTVWDPHTLKDINKLDGPTQGR